MSLAIILANWYNGNESGYARKRGFKNIKIKAKRKGIAACCESENY